MLRLLLACVVALSVCWGAFGAGSNYAVLVAGSNEYYNYRHQADVCHAFQILTDPKKGNFPKENIIVFMYDDIANNPENPVPGNVINHPNGTNVYPGVNKDYTGDAVTPENFLNVLRGNKTGSGPVLHSGPNDDVFIYFTDHGAPGLIAFPSEYLYADDLMKALQFMHDHKMYRQLVFYIEACESGSMFDGILPDNINIYATTAATPDQSSYACYYDATRQTYLGDEYSVRWMEDSDSHDSRGSTWSLQSQFKLVTQETLQSQPQQYGNETISNEVVEDFQGYQEGGRSSTPKSTVIPKFTPCESAVDSRDVKVRTLMNRFDDALEGDDEDLQAFWGRELEAELVHRAQADLYADAIVEKLVGGIGKNRLKRAHYAPTDFQCLKDSVAAVESSCGKFSDYSLKHVYMLVNLCEEGVPAEKIANAAAEVCGDF